MATDKVDMIYDMVKAHGEKMDRIVECTTKLKVQGQDRESRIAVLEGCAKRQEELIRLHMENQDAHFNPYFSESYPAKIRRKSPEILTGVSISSIISGIIIGVMKVKGWL